MSAISHARDEADGAMTDKAESVLMRHQCCQMGAEKARGDLDHEIGKTPFEEHGLPFNNSFA
jgi:hypothetical protein